MASVAVRMGTYEILIKRLKIDNIVTRAIFFDTDEVFEGLISNDGRDTVDTNTKEIFEEIKSDDNGRILFDAKKEYPFTKDKTELLQEEKRDDIDTSTVIEKIKRHINFFLKERLFLHNPATELALIYDDGINWYMNERLIYLGKSYWYYSDPNGPIDQFAPSIDTFNTFLKTKNIPLLYVGIPDKLSPDSIYINSLDYVNLDKDFAYEELRKHGIPNLDLRENIRNEGKDWYSSFYNIDTHWKVETGLWASKIIAWKLNSDFGFDLDISLLNSQNYKYEFYKNQFISSWSITPLFKNQLATKEDFTLITPKFETRYDILQFRSDSIYATKRMNVNFDSAFINRNRELQYGSYMYGLNCSLIHNKLNSNGKKLLIIGESNVVVLTPFLSVVIEYVVGIHLGYFNGSLETLIEKEKPDIVIIAYRDIYNLRLTDNSRQN
jgi:hypothetical protein